MNSSSNIISNSDMTDYYNGIANGYDELYRNEQLLKLKFIENKIHSISILKEFYNPKYKMLDVGCGTGVSTSYFKFEESYGVDPSKELVKVAIKNYPKINFLIAPAEFIPFKDNNFDLIISLTAIQNFSDIEKGLLEIKRLSNKYVLTFLKKSPKRELIESLIEKHFHIIKKFEEDKDMIYFCE